MEKNGKYISIPVKPENKYRNAVFGPADDMRISKYRAYFMINLIL